MATFDEFYASLDPDARIRGKQFEKFVKWFLKTDPTWASQVDAVWLWNEYPKRWGADCGIDLVFTLKNGKTWAVQSKCISPTNDIKKSEIDSFLSESSDSKIDGRLLIASTDGIGKNAQQVIDRQEKQVVCFLLEQFRQSEIDFPYSMEDLNKGKRKEKKIPRDHQIEVIKSVSEGLKNTNRGQVLMACGTGKTLTSLWIKEDLRANQVLVLVPSLSLLSQTLKEWNSEANYPFKWICVCSDKSVAKDKSEDQLITNISEIGVPVTSDPLEIKNFLDESGSKVIFSTYQSALLIVEAQEHHDTSDFDLVIADEAHRCAGKVSDAFGSVLDENKIKASKRLFFTATPRILSSQLKKNAQEKEIEVVSMDDYSVFGRILHQIKFSEAIEKDLLSDYQVVVVGVDDEMVMNQIRNRDLLEISTNGLKKDAETLASHIALTKAIKEYELRRVITFHGLVKGAKNFAEDHLKVHEWIYGSSESLEEISAAHVSGDMNSAERNKRINELKNIKKGGIGILTNARCLSEGVDVPTLDAIAFIDPRQSQVDIIQAVGRAIRKSENKTTGTIVIPVYLSEVSADIDDQILSSRFSSVWKIILALKSQDDSLMEEIDSLRVHLGQRGNRVGKQKGINKIIVDLPAKVSTSFINKFQTILVKNTSDNWNEYYGRLLRYIDENGTICFQSYVDNEGINLGNWVGNQRARKNILSKEKYDLLDSLEVWNWDEREARWMEGYYHLQKFVEENGHTYPGKKFINQSGYNLGRWVDLRRRDPQSVTAEHKELLESLPGWDWQDKYDHIWSESYKELVEFVKENGSATPGDDFITSTGLQLGKWVGKQRSKKDTMILKRKEKLEKLNGWTWDAREDLWIEGIKQLKKFHKKNNHISITNKFVDEDGFKLGQWVSSRRGRKKTLSDEKIKELEDFPDWTWDKNESSWKEGYQSLKSYTQQNGTADPPANFRDNNGYLVGGWVRRQRYNWEKLDPQKKELLNQLNGWKIRIK